MSLLIILLTLAASSAFSAGQTAVQLFWTRSIAERGSAPPVALGACKIIVKAGFASNAGGFVLGVTILCLRATDFGRGLPLGVNVAFAGNALATALFWLGLPWYVFCSLRWRQRRAAASHH
jgi:hypothetical protein